MCGIRATPDSRNVRGDRWVSGVHIPDYYLQPYLPVGIAPVVGELGSLITLRGKLNPRLGDPPSLFVIGALYITAESQPLA